MDELIFSYFISFIINYFCFFFFSGVIIKTYFIAFLFFNIAKHKQTQTNKHKQANRNFIFKKKKKY